MSEPSDRCTGAIASSSSPVGLSDKSVDPDNFVASAMEVSEPEAMENAPYSQPSQCSTANASSSVSNSFDRESFKFCEDQITSPVVIEIFLWQCQAHGMHESLGMTASFGVDHKLDKAVASAKQLDLTLPEHQQTFLCGCDPH